MADPNTAIHAPDDVRRRGVAQRSGTTPVAEATQEDKPEHATS